MRRRLVVETRLQFGLIERQNVFARRLLHEQRHIEPQRFRHVLDLRQVGGPLS